MTDAPENQRNNVIDELYEHQSGRLVRLENKNNCDLFRLYEWTLFFPNGRPTDVQSAPCNQTFGGQSFACTCSSSRNTWHGKAVTLEDSQCPDFLSGHTDQPA